MSTKPYPPEFKAKVLAAVATGQSVNSASKEFGVSRAAIMDWQRETGLSRPTDVAQQKRIEIGEQLVGYLQESITTLEFLVRCVRDEKWIKKHSPNDVAILYGVLTDKSVRLLAALQSPPATDDGGGME